MPSINIPHKRVPANESKYGKGFYLNSISSSDYESFNPSVLGLGDIAKDGKYVQALAAFFDLEGFTSFSNQVDSHLVIPEFLQRFLEWLFTTLADRFRESEDQDTVTIWGSLPIFSKFLGDGILFLWDTEHSRDLSGIRNIIARLLRITELYREGFFPKINKEFSKPPIRLRCGVARGQIISIGDGNDYVGSCINLASRLQKLGELSFAVSRRGIDLSDFSLTHKPIRDFVLRKVELRGIGTEELVYVLEEEFSALRASKRRFFKEP